ncbi:MAG: hypothetical protein U1F98_04310 [Verrucomicrobiota bacterium]
MNTTKRCIFGVVVLIVASSQSIQAIEGLKLSIQSRNAVLSWPSVEGENYIVQYRPSLGPSTPWQTLTSWLPADTSTNRTYFVHVNAIQNPAFATVAPMSTGIEVFNEATDLAGCDDAAPDEILAVPVNSLGTPAPLALYPPGFDLSGFIVVSPSTDEAVNGAGYKVAMQRTSSLEAGDPTPIDDGTGDGGSNTSAEDPDPGYYRVVRMGAHLIGITNGMTLSGTLTIPIEFGNDAGTLSALSIREDGVPVGNSQAVGPFAVPPSIVLDTTAMSNGVHQIYVNATWDSGGNEGSQGIVEIDSLPATVTVYNEITFPNWISYYGELYDSMLISAQSVHTDADWYADVYGSESGYIGTFAGHTYDGNIVASWNLIGPYGESHAGESYFQFVFETDWTASAMAQADAGQTQSSAGSATTVSPKTYRQTDNWVSKGMWVVANQQAWQGAVGADVLDSATDQFVQLATSFGLTTRPAHNYAEAFRISFADNSSISIKTSQWLALRQAIYHPESRNFFYLGHGSPTGLGASDNTNLFIPASEIASSLHTMPAGQTDRHGFRFVFLYGCSTANGTLPESFGVIHRPNVQPIEYASAALTPSAFVGWNDDHAAEIAGSAMTDNALYLGYFLSEWTSGGRGLNDALDAAKNNHHDVVFVSRSHIKAFGNWNLTPIGFNH